LTRKRFSPLLLSRPEFKSPWGAHGHVTLHSLNRLGKRQSALLVDQVTGKPLPRVLVDQIIVTTDGVPLFIEELTKAVVESDIVKDAENRYELTGAVDGLAIPDTLHDSLMARLDKLIPVKEVAQVGAAIGREFSHQLLSPMSRSDLDNALDKLVASELVDDLQTTRGSAARSRNLRLTAIRSFFRYAAFEALAHSAQIQWVLAIPNQRCPRALVGFLVKPEIDAFWPHLIPAVGSARFAITPFCCSPFKLVCACLNSPRCAGTASSWAQARICAWLEKAERNESRR
jgi:hypothetical protein